MPHPLALFSLKPLNERARNVVAHPGNAHRRSALSDGEVGLDVGFHIHSQSHNTLAILGRGGTDIIVEGSLISRIQCSFELNPDSGLVVLYDRSHGQSTQVFGEHATPFELDRNRRVVVGKGINTKFGMGGERQNLIEFELIWHQDIMKTTEKTKNQGNFPYRGVENPSFARTGEKSALARTEDVDPDNDRLTRVHLEGKPPPKMRYIKQDLLGGGNYGKVYRAIDVDSAKFMAVKILQASTKNEAAMHDIVKREVETLSRIKHPCIIDYISSQGWKGKTVEIFMGLKEGTLHSLIEHRGSLMAAGSDSVLYQMLQALDCLANLKIAHRDVKPENILYVSLPNGQFKFQLGDFGSCSRSLHAGPFAGSTLYMAPEAFGRGFQTSKMDIWSLFVTMLWTTDAGQFRQHFSGFKTAHDVQEAVLHAATATTTLPPISKIREMALVDPEARASAAQILVMNYGGEGLSTPRHQVPPLFVRPLLPARSSASSTR